MLFIYMLENWKILGQLCQSVSQKGHLSIDVKTREGATHKETTLRVCSHVAALGGYTQRVLCCDNANMLQFTIYNVQILVQLMGRKAKFISNVYYIHSAVLCNQPRKKVMHCCYVGA